jgi:GH15 family glucan-1,4-alpha-glucosidase
VFQIRNTGSRPQDVRLFFNHDLILAESDVGNTALYHPGAHGIVHFKGRHAVLFAGEPFFQFHTGVKYGDSPGTAGDAEDGFLSGKPVEQGAVDSTFSLKLKIAPGETCQATYCACCGDSVEAALAAYQQVSAQGFEAWLEQEAAEGERRATSDAAIFGSFNGETRELLGRSLLILNTQIDPEGGITAANDSDIMIGNRGNYSYVWPRDGALVAQVLDLVGDHFAAQRYFDFCARLGIGERGTFLQKYRTDGALGATWHPWTDWPELPMQEDETSLTLLALCDHLDATGRTAYPPENWKEMAMAMTTALVRFIDQATGLPRPSYNLWEERLGVHTFTVAATIAGLQAGARLLSGWGVGSGRVAEMAAEEMRTALRERLFDPKLGGFYSMLRPDGAPDTTADASTLLIGVLGALPPDDPMVVANQNRIRKRLTIRSDIGGLARYENDWYWRVAPNHTGNPWVISTMWMAQLKILQATASRDLREPTHAIQWALRLARPTGVLAEQYHPDTGAPLSVSPLTWSHAEVIRTAVMLARRKAELAGT